MTDQNENLEKQINETVETPQQDTKKQNPFITFCKDFLEGIANFFVVLFENLKTWFNDKIVVFFKGSQEKPSLKQRLVKIGLFFKNLPKNTVVFFKGLPLWFKTLPNLLITWAKSLTKDNVKTFFLGNGEKKGFIPCFISYTLLILFGFVYIYPMLYMLGYSLMSPTDVTNPMVNYLPTELYFKNYQEASQVLRFGKTLLQTIYIAVLPAIFQTISCCLAAYGLARFEFKGKKIIFALIILTFIVPTQLTMMPQVLIYSSMKIIDTIWTFVLPAAFGQGIKSAVFVLIFYQFFKGIPESVIEAAKIDGAGSFKIFVKIGLSAAKPAILLAMLLSIVWYYNETVLTTIYVGGGITTLPIELEKFESSYTAIFGGTTTATGKSANEAIYMAGTLLSILPLIVFYFFTQKHFTEGIDKAGITGE